jgi:hypothetical protein
MNAMTSLPPWPADQGSLTLTETQYDSLPDRVRKLIEVIDRNVTFCPSSTPEHRDVTRTTPEHRDVTRTTPEHRDVTRTLATRLDATRPAEPGTQVSTCAEMHFIKRRRSDGSFPSGARISRCPGARTRTPNSSHATLAESGYEGIPLYLLAFLGGDPYLKMIQGVPRRPCPVRAVGRACAAGASQAGRQDGGTGGG